MGKYLATAVHSAIFLDIGIFDISVKRSIPNLLASHTFGRTSKSCSRNKTAIFPKKM